MRSPGYAVRAEGLVKTYGRTRALEGFDLAARPGNVHGLLGPNGAGKTTAVQVLATLLRFEGGRAEVAGYDVRREAAQVRSRIGLVGQHPAVDEILSGRQNLEMFGRLYHLDRRAAARRAEALLGQFGLADTGRKPVRQYSGGMRRRLDLAAGLILTPAVLFLDEPTTGLDPHGRNEVWQAIRALTAGGTTVLLTTQYLDEADQLADQISVMSTSAGRGGRVIAEGTPDELKSLIGGDRLDVVVRDATSVGAAAEVLARISGNPPDVDPDSRRVSVRVTRRVDTLSEVVRALDERRIVADDLGLRRPTLDEAFLQLTGAGDGVAA